MYCTDRRYHYLLHADADLISLDDYVFNTGKHILAALADLPEAHPFLLDPTLKPGHSGLWMPPSPSSPHFDLGVRAEGTHAQKWTRYALLEPLKKSLRIAAGLGGQPEEHVGGGKGMGGGGGRPGHIPPLPKEFYMRPGVITG